jgi:hypothetical protein
LGSPRAKPRTGSGGGEREGKEADQTGGWRGEGGGADDEGEDELLRRGGEVDLRVGAGAADLGRGMGEAGEGRRDCGRRRGWG